MMIVFLHGLESGPHGSKYQFLKTLGDVLAPDFRACSSLEERVKVAEEATRGMQDLFLVGSSFGGLLAATLYCRYPDRIAGYLLLAPALHLPEAAAIDKVPQVAAIIHGLHDEIVPIAASRAFRDKFEVPMLTVPDGHRLSNSKEHMLGLVKFLRS